jgi:hypothetical protein
MVYSYGFFYLVCEAIGTAATPGLMCQPRVIVKMIVEKQIECRLAGETCPSATFVHYKIPHDQTRVWNRAAAVGSRRLTAWAMARPQLWGCTKPSNTKIIQGFQSKVLRLITNAPCYDSNFNLHNNLQISFVIEEIHRLSTLHHQSVLDAITD